MATVQKFDTLNAAGGRQFVAHGIYVGGSNGKHSLWFSDTDGGTLVDAERIYRGKTSGVKRDGLKWRVLARRVPGLIAQWEKENS